MTQAEASALLVYADELEEEGSWEHAALLRVKTLPSGRWLSPGGVIVRAWEEEENRSAGLRVGRRGPSATYLELEYSWVKEAGSWFRWKGETSKRSSYVSGGVKVARWVREAVEQANREAIEQHWELEGKGGLRR